jgi:ParB family chromosome partitioning protein
LSVRKVEELVRQVVSRGQKTEGSKPSSAPSREMNTLQASLSSHFGTKVNVKSDGKKGEIRIPFLSVEDLNRILEILKL